MGIKQIIWGLAAALLTAASINVIFAAESAASLSEEYVEIDDSIKQSTDVVNLSATSGTCGDNLTWTLEDGVLTISGTGDMKDYQSTNP